jgi:hypothetical protein
LIAEVLPIARVVIMLLLLLLLHELEGAAQHLRRHACSSGGCEGMRSLSCTSHNLKTAIVSAATAAVAAAAGCNGFRDDVSGNHNYQQQGNLPCAEKLPCRLQHSSCCCYFLMLRAEEPGRRRAHKICEAALAQHV